ncbi:pyridoxal phosphate-dependent aminotransferase [Oceanobacillus kimchii]|uniref:Aminotransferase n=1 Tax=Oceanobacillus kimchii TaxID=746691 RepID=A0ABQ5TG59_9BACI|nr:MULTISPECIES: pyridoxal phosphate-dependent aminotransferase [Oceanobacillus]MCT1577593.1 pyridoxal phosphate-dependent aminotransferase [Oceanobacillus kimchii]MCT2136581.1 pyridoxal phosphate-dependent aminotransferase [Oceanobacillus kimchii]OEH53723.1 LL-diaminopimelate aminotransferase [Oceanobacillus sp. E9]GLO64691.1 aminotransferase [Oceanobacillus kimchii]
MKQSKRLKQLPPQFFASLVQKVNQAISEGRDVINLGQGNPDQPTPSHIIKALQSAAEDPITHKYSPFRGTEDFRKAAATFYKREYQVDLDPDTEIAILFGSKIGLVELPLALMNPNEWMMLPNPGYPDYLSSIPLADIQYDTMPLLEENNFLPNYEQLTLSQKERTKLLYLNYPNNPTGATAHSDFFKETVALGKNYDIGIVHDFAYGAIGFNEEKPISFLQTEGAKEVGIELYTLSKTYNMAGWRIGFAAGNKEMIEAINILQDHLFVSIFPAIQRAASEALLSDQSSVQDLVTLYQKRRDTLITECKRIGWDIKAPKGSFFAWLPVPKGFTSETFADYLLNQVDVAVAAGNGFGTFGEGYIRIGLLVDEERIVEAMKRIERLNLF